MTENETKQAKNRAVLVGLNAHCLSAEENADDTSMEELADLLGLTPGSVTPFGALNDKEHRVTLLLDEDYRGKLIGVHPNDNTATVWLPADALVELLRQQGSTVEFIPF